MNGLNLPEQEIKKLYIEKDKINKKNKGHIVTNKTREKISNSLKGKHHSEESKRKMGDTRIEKELSKGENHPRYKDIISKEELEDLYLNKKLSANEIAKKFNCEKQLILTRLNIFKIKTRKNAEAIKLYWQDKIHPFVGRKLSEETKKKISEKNKGKIHSEETKRKISIALKGQLFHTDKNRNKKISDTHKLKYKLGINKSGFKKGHKPLYIAKGKENPKYRADLDQYEEDIVKMYNKKFTIDEISKKFDCSATPIKKILMKNRIKIRRLGVRKGKFARENNPYWKGGKSFEPYTPDFNKNFKNKIKERDNHTCQLCNLFEEDSLKLYGKMLDIHHIDFNKLNSFPQNCITLCVRCHALINKDKEIWIKHFHELLKKLYGYEYTQDQKIIVDFTK